MADIAVAAGHLEVRRRPGLACGRVDRDLEPPATAQPPGRPCRDAAGRQVVDPQRKMGVLVLPAKSAGAGLRGRPGGPFRERSGGLRQCSRVRRERRRQPTVPGQRPAQRRHRVAVRRSVVGRGAAPDGPDHVGAEARPEVLPEHPVAVLVETGGVEPVQRGPGLGDLSVREVAAVVVGAVGHLLLHPRGRRLEQPGVLPEVVAELDRMEELVCGGHPQADHRLDAVLLPGEVVVEHAVAGGDVPLTTDAVLGCAVAVEPLRPELLEVDVEPTVSTVSSVARRPPEAHPAHLGAPHPVHHPQRRVRPGLVGGRVAGAADVVHADRSAAGPGGGDPVAVAVGVATPVTRPGQHPGGSPLLDVVHRRPGDEDVAEHHRGVLPVRRGVARPIEDRVRAVEHRVGSRPRIGRGGRGRQQQRGSGDRGRDKAQQELPGHRHQLQCRAERGRAEQGRIGGGTLGQ